MSPNEELRLIAVMRSAESGAEVAALCANVGETRVDVRVSNIEDFAKQSEHLNGSDVLLLDINKTHLEDDRVLREIVSGKSSQTPVLVTAPDVTLEQIRSLMQLGVIDVLQQPIRQADLVIALDHASRLRPQAEEQKPSERGKVISFLQGGGGVGATVLAAQGGCALAREVAEEGAKVCLLDFDIQFGTAGLYLDLNSSVGFVDLLESTDRLDASFLRGAMTKHESGLEVLIAPPTIIPLDVVTPEFMTNCLALAREIYDYVLVDLPTNWTSWSYSILCESDIVLMISEMTVGGIGQTIRQFETLREQDVSRPIVQLVLNKYERGWSLLGKSFGKSANVDDAERALGRKFDHYVTRDDELFNEVINQGVPLDTVEGSKRVHKEIDNLMSSCRDLLDSPSVKSASGAPAHAATEGE